MLSSIFHDKVDIVNNIAWPRPMTDNEQVLEALHALMHRYKRHMHQALREQDGGIGPMEARALAFFARQPGSSASDLVAHSGRDKAQIARLLQQLLDRGLLAREADPADGRRQQLALTDSGRAAQRVMARQRQRFASQISTGLDAAEQAQLLALLKRLIAQADGPAPG